MASLASIFLFHLYQIWVAISLVVPQCVAELSSNPMGFVCELLVDSWVGCVYIYKYELDCVCQDFTNLDFTNLDFKKNARNLSYTL